MSSERNKTLYPAPVPATGQTTKYHDGDDGHKQKGVAWPNPRFTDNEDGTVTDNLTGLIWLQNANAFDKQTWEGALKAANELQNGDRDLSDGSRAGQWRLPNVRELCSLIDYEECIPAFPEDHPFTSNPSGRYWSSSASAYSTAYGWYVDLSGGFVSSSYKTDNYYYVWPVRGGQ